MSTDAINQIIASYFAAIRAMDVEAWVATFDEDIISYEPSSTSPLKGLAAMSQFFQSIAGEFEKLGLTEDQIFIVGNEAAVKWTGYGIGKNGREVTFEGIDIFEVNAAGKIQTQRAYWNPAAMMAQLQG